MIDASQEAELVEGKKVCKKMIQVKLT